ncbi:hypothetical protein [Endozoicomonas sp. ONNA2]|uniref:hypothetical protein n=1 Tax=Endozoicomonas sp. ONNA2 TaxID=2828741 RepID=UPI0021489372|nr:hypothetical protein [Endozoicomonas sp. ONNA2]
MFTHGLNTLKRVLPLANSQFSAMAAKPCRNRAGNQLFSGRAVLGPLIHELHVSARSGRCDSPDDKHRSVKDGSCIGDNIQDDDTRESNNLLQDRRVGMGAEKASHLARACGSDDTVLKLWDSPLQIDDPDILARLQCFLSQESVHIDQPVNQAQQTLLHQFTKASGLHHCNGGQRYPVDPVLVVKLLLNRGASLAPDRFGNTPLHTACQSCAAPELMDILLKKASGRPEILDAVNSDGKTALCETLSLTSWLGNAVLLLRAGASIDDVGNQFSDGPVGSLIHHKRLDSESINLLTHYGFDINQRTQEGKLPFNEFVRNMNSYDFYRDSDTLLYLIKSGLPLNRLDNAGQSLLSICFNAFDENSEENSGFNRKLNLCSFVLKAAYKYNFPGNIDALKGAFSDTLIETRAKDIGNLLTGYADVFYLIDGTIDVIADNVSEQNKRKLAELLAKAGKVHCAGMSLRPFVYLPREPFAQSCKDSFMHQMAVRYNAPISDFVRVGLEPEPDRFSAIKSEG